MALTLHGTVSDNTVALDRKTATPLIINGDMQIAQRGTSTADVGSTEGYITVDRFNFNQNGNPSARFTVTQDSDVPTGYGFVKSSKVDCTTAQGSLGSDDFLTIEHRLEGQNLQVLKKGTSNAEYLTIAFWVKTNKTGTYILEIRDIDNNRLITSTYAVSSANTWEKKVISFVGDTTGALDNDNAHSMQIAWCLMAGTDFTSGTQRTSWATRVNADRFVNQGVNLADSTDNNFWITGIQAEVGQFDADSIPAFQFEDRGTSLARCQRYFHKGVAEDGSTSGYAFGAFRTANTAQFLHQFPVPMRTEPTATQIATDNMFCHDLADGNNILVDSIQSVLHNCEQNILIQYTLDSSSGSAGDSAYLYPTGSTPGVTFDSEL